MKTIQMTLNEDLLDQVDQKIKQLNTSRSAFIRYSLKHYLKELVTQELENEHRRGYEKFPVEDKEFDIWENEQEWGF